MAASKDVEAEKIPESAENLFSKDQILASDRFQSRRDILHALLSDEEKYTINNVEQIIEKYMKGKVK